MYVLGDSSLSEGSAGRGLSSMGLFLEAPGGRLGVARERARREGGPASKTSRRGGGTEFDIQLIRSYMRSCTYLQAVYIMY